MKQMVGGYAFYKANGMPSPMLSCNIRIFMLYASESGQLLMFLGNWRFVNWGSQAAAAAFSDVCWSAEISRVVQVCTWTNAAMNQGRCVSKPACMCIAVLG